MKKLLTVVILLISFAVNAQKITVCVDRGQNFEHDSTLSTVQAIREEKVKYLTAGETQLTYTFDFDNMVMTRQFNNEEPTTKKMIKNSNSKDLIDVLVQYSDGIRNYSLFENNSKYIFVSRTYEGNKLTGWFDDNVEIKKRP